MPNQLSSGDIIASIQTDMADNNAGLISAQDVRHNMEDIAFSINRIVASGDTATEFPFFNPVKVSKDNSLGATATSGNGDMAVESGIFFPFCDDVTKQTKRMTEPWLGDTGVDHGNLAGLGDDDHTQYLHRNGVDIVSRDNHLLGNLETADVWINTSGIENVGFQFETTNADATEQTIHTSGLIKFKHDNSEIPNTAKGMARVWCNFDASGATVPLDNKPEVRSYYNIESIERLAQGKLKITFASGAFDNNNYTAMATANATTATGSMEDFSVNTVGLVLREGNNGPDDSVTKRTITYVIKNENGDYVDSQLCDFAAWGYKENETSGTPPTMVGI